MEVRASSDVALEFNGDTARATATTPGKHTLDLSASVGKLFEAARIEMFTFENPKIEKVYPPPELVDPVSEVAREIEQRMFTYCGNDGVATSTYFACVGGSSGLGGYGTIVFGTDLSRILNEDWLTPLSWGLGGDGPLLGRASVFEEGLKVDEIGADGTFLRRATYTPPPNPVKEILTEPGCKKRCSYRKANEANNVAIQSDLVAMTDLIGGLYLLRYANGALAELWKTYEHAVPNVGEGNFDSIPVHLSGTQLAVVRSQNFIVYDASDPTKPRLAAKGRMLDLPASATFDSGKFWFMRNGALEVHSPDGERLIKVAEFRLGTEAGLLAVRSGRAIVLDRESIHEIEYKPGAGLILARQFPHFGLPVGTASIAPDGSVYLGGGGFVLRYR